MLDLSNADEVRALIQERHWSNRESVRSIERDLGLTKTRLFFWCKRHGIALRSRLDAIAITNVGPRPSTTGENHWHRRNPERAAETTHLSSVRMTLRNPSQMRGVVERGAVSRAKGYKREPTFHEQIV